MGSQPKYLFPDLKYWPNALKTKQQEKKKQKTPTHNFPAFQDDGGMICVVLIVSLKYNSKTYCMWLAMIT